MSPCGTVTVPVAVGGARSIPLTANQVPVRVNVWPLSWSVHETDPAALSGGEFEQAPLVVAAGKVEANTRGGDDAGHATGARVVDRPAGARAVAGLIGGSRKPRAGLRNAQGALVVAGEPGSRIAHDLEIGPGPGHVWR